MSKEPYKKFRPKQLSDVIGQDKTVEELKALIKDNDLPHTILLSGPSGCGKTTIARILRHVVKCGKTDFIEMNCRKIDEVRDIKMRMRSAPIDGDSRVWLIDECHMLTSDAQNEFLKILEDTPDHVYFFLATTEPEKLKRTIRTRGMHFALNPLKDNAIEYIVKSVLKKMEAKIPDEVITKIGWCAEGSAREALVMLHQVMKLKSKKDMLAAIEPPEITVNTQEIVKLLLGKAKWKSIVPYIKKLQDEDVEVVRRRILGYTNACMINGKEPNICYRIIEAFRDNFFDSGKAGLVGACFEVAVGE